MMPARSWNIDVRLHPGSAQEDIEREPDWSKYQSSDHYVGYRNSQRRYPGHTHAGDERTEDSEEVQEAWSRLQALNSKTNDGKLVNFRDIVQNQKDFHIDHPDNRSVGWRFALDFTEDWIKNGQEWPINVKKKQQQKKDKEQSDRQRREQNNDVLELNKDNSETSDQRSQQGFAVTEENKQLVRYGDNTAEKSNIQRSKAAEKFLRDLQADRDYIHGLLPRSGQECSNVENRTSITIDEADQFTPDNWIPRSSHLIRLTGKHPLNAEVPLSMLFGAGFITPNELHYVRSHGGVPRLLWEYHKLDVQSGKLVLSMHELKSRFKSINIPVAIGCDNSRRKEVNMIKQTKGFNWGPGGIGCAFWKGPLLRDILMLAGVPEKMPDDGSKLYHVHFRGADDLEQGNYETSIPFQYAMDPNNDVLLAYEMNDVPLPPDHGYPVRLVIPGYVGGRCVKWLSHIWVSEKENDSYYHIWDNRTVPSFVEDFDSEIAKVMFHHHDTACYEQMLNSIICKPAQDETIDLENIREGQTYRIAGLAYNGRGDEIQRVEVSIDGRKSWLYAFRKYPERPVRNGHKFWTWLFWHIDVDLVDLIRSESITVRCFNSAKMTQPEHPHWNILGSMNNSWYTVKLELIKKKGLHLMFQHPVEPATGEGGWMKPSNENKISIAKRNTQAPARQFTREEIENHDNEHDCWIVVDGQVYDATSVLPWHPGGAAAILTHAGKVYQETSTEFASIHDEDAYDQLAQCVLGTVTNKARKLIQQSAKDPRVQDAKRPSNCALLKHRWTSVKLSHRKEVSKDARVYTFDMPKGKTMLGLGVCQHIEFGFHMKDKMLIRAYTPTRPVLPYTVGDTQDGLCDGSGSFQLTVKTYFPDENQPGGALSNILDTMPIGEEIEIRGPTGDIIYLGHGKFSIYGDERVFSKVSLVLGGSGVTPGYQLMAHIALSEDAGDRSKKVGNGIGRDLTKIRVIDANKTEDDILLHEDLTRFQEDTDGQITITHVVHKPNDSWKGIKGLINKDIIREHLFPPAEDSLVLLCGPPGMINHVVLPVLEEWGYEHNQNLYGL